MLVTLTRNIRLWLLGRERGLESSGSPLKLLVGVNTPPTPLRDLQGAYTGTRKF